MIRVRIGNEQHELTWEDWEQRVRSGRIPPDALVSFEAVTQGAFVPASELELYRSLRNDAAVAWQSNFLAGPPPLLTALLVGFQIRVWWFARIDTVRDELVTRFTNWTGPALENGELWRPITMGFLHTDLFHLVLNMLWLAYTGWNIERALGPRNLLTIYLSAVVGGSVLSMFGSPETPSLGASGGVFGLVAASTIFGLVRPELLPQRGRRLFGMAMLPYLVIMFWSGLMNEDTDNWSHFGGLLVGLFLGFVLTPEPLQRVPGWNRRWRRGAASVCVLVLVALQLLGPRVEPLVDSEVARIQAQARPGPLPPDTVERPLRYEVPAGWRPDMDGIPVFKARQGERSFGVRARRHDQLVDVATLGEAWLAQLEERWPDARSGAAEPATVAGREGQTIRAVFDADGVPRGVEWWGAVEGIHSVEIVWTIELTHATRLDPLRDRLLAGVRWSDPAEVDKARAEVKWSPRSPKARTDLAMALARAGHTDEAVALHLALIGEVPADPDRWVDLFRTVRLGGVTEAEEAPWWDEALAQAGNGRVVVEVVAGLDARGRPDEAVGLLDVAWTHRPGDRIVRRARRARGLSVGLLGDGTPWDDAIDPVSGDPRPPEDLEALRSTPLTLAGAREAATRRAAVREDAVTGACADLRAGGAPWTALLWLRDADLPDPEDLDVGEAMATDLATPAAWVPPELAACVTPEALQQLRTVLPPVR